MKKIIYNILLILFTVFFIGCSESNSADLEKLNKYIEELSVVEEVSGNFNLPRELNGEKDHVITWESSDEEIIFISNIKTITGVDHYIAIVNQGAKDVVVTLKAVIDMKSGISSEKEFTVVVKEDISIKEEKIKYVKEILSQFHNLEIKESITLPVVTKQYGLEIVWSSSNNDIISSRGEYKAPQEDTVVELTAVVNEAGVELYKEAIRVKAVNKNTIEKEIVLDFVSNFDTYAINWDSSYTERKITNTDLGVKNNISIIFSRVNRQAAGNSISDRPVVAAKSSTEYITIQIEEGTFKIITFSLVQWTTKTFNNIHMEYYNGSSWVKCSNDITTPSDITSQDLPSGVTQIRIVIKTTESKNVQLGLSSITFELN